jgi:hypothetical protein
VQGIVDVLQSGVGVRRRLIDLGRTLHVESFVRTLVVEDINKFIKAGLLLQKVRGRRLGGFFLQSEMHAFVTTVLLGMVFQTSEGYSTNGGSQCRLHHMPCVSYL